MTTTYETDASTSTIAAAWASSPLGDPISGPTETWETAEHTEAAAPTAKPMSLARHAALVVALAGGIGAGAALGLALFDFAEPAHPTVAVPPASAQGAGVPGANQAAPLEAVSAPVNAPAPNPVVSVAQGAPGSKPVVPALESTPQASLAPPADTGSGPADAGSPPAGAPGGPTVIIDITIPSLPDPPKEAPKPEPANPDGPELTLQAKPPGEPTLQQKPPQQVTTLPPKPKPMLATPAPQNAGPSLDQATTPPAQETGPEEIPILAAVPQEVQILQAKP